MVAARLLLLSSLASVAVGFSSSPLPSLRHASPRSFLSSSVASPRMTAAPPPPGRKSFFNGIKETVQYIVDGDNFIRKRVAEFGPVFSAKIFFLPTVIVGGANNVEEFLGKEGAVMESSLPPALQKLFTDNNLLLQSGERHDLTKKGLTGMLDVDAQKAYIPVIEERAEEHLNQIAERGETALGRDFTTWSLQLFAELFAGCKLTEEEVDLFVTYNAGLFALTDWEPSFVKAEKARETLERRFEARFKAMKEDGSVDDPKNFCYKKIASAKNTDGSTFSDYKVGFAITSMIWGAYIETAALMSSTIIATLDRPEVVDRVRQESASLLSDQVNLRGSFQEWNVPYTQGVLRECLRTLPPAGGGFRKSDAPISVGGYLIPEGTVITADPRPGNLDPEMFPEPDTFAPERWASEADLGASKCPMSKLVSGARSLPAGAWFPGGTGVHKCPGVPLAELIARVMLVKWADKFGEWSETSKRVYIPSPIKIPKDSYTMKVVPRNKA